MKNLLLLGLITVFFACQPQQKQRYFSESPEIDAAKAIIEGYLASDYSAHKSTYAESAEIYHNTIDPVTLDQLIENFISQDEVLSSKGFEESIYEMVIDSREETWVGFWANFVGTLKANGATIKVPVHVSWQFVDGKITEEYAYFDNQVMYEAINKANQEAASEGAEEAEEEGA
jgi:hypothetical protein